MPNKFLKLVSQQVKNSLPNLRSLSIGVLVFCGFGVRNFQVLQVPQKGTELNHKLLMFCQKHMRNLYLASSEHKPHTYGMGRVDLKARPVALMGKVFTIPMPWLGFLGWLSAEHQYFLIWF